MLILRLNKAGMPQGWLTKEHAAKYYAQDKVLFELGENAYTLYGGWNHLGEQSRISLSSIIACDGKITNDRGTLSLCNRYLFRRDDFTCLYCGNQFPISQLTRDHIVPRCQGGKDSWTNVATACTRCNHLKGSKSLEQAGLTLLAVPFKPNIYERFYLMNRKILADQMAFLSGHFTLNRNWQ